MSAPEEKDPERPPCSHCGWLGTVAHCTNAMCTWVRCKTCDRLTDVRRLKNQEGA